MCISTGLCLSNGLPLEAISHFVIKWADLFVFRTNFQNEFKLEIREVAQTLRDSCHYRWAWEERKPHLVEDLLQNRHWLLQTPWFRTWCFWKYLGTRLRSSPWYLEGFFIAYTISLGDRGSRCTSPWCGRADLGSGSDAAEIGAAVLALTILRAPAVVPVRKAKGMMCYFLY